MKFFFSLLLLSLGCRKESPKVELAEVTQKESQKLMSETIEPAPSPVTAPTAEIVEAWKSLWKEKDQLAQLKKFQLKHGLFLKVGSPGAHAYLSEEGPCGMNYTQLVSDSSSLVETVWEIDQAGMSLKRWNTGIEAPFILRIEGDKVFRPVSFYEDPQNFNLNAGENSPKKDFILAVHADQSLELLTPSAENSKKSTFTRIDCPPLKEKNDFMYCVKDEKTQRLFIFQAPCT